MSAFALNPRLDNDSALVTIHDRIEIRLLKQAAVPWLILVPHTTATEWLYLEPELQASALALQNRISLHLLNDLNADKINTALIGNVVEQMHLHVIARRHDDAFWPDVVWGKKLIPYTDAELAQSVSQWQSWLA